ncbi:MAG: hypothetical protein ACRD4L_03335 [Pyrinomonadaceae bacterium]
MKKNRSMLAILSVVVFSIIAVVASAWLLLTPIPEKVSAHGLGECRNNCPDGTTVSCSGDRVRAIDGDDPGCECDSRVVLCSDKKKEAKSDKADKEKKNDKKKPKEKKP